MKEVSLEQNVPLATLLLTAWQVLLYRYTNQKKVTVGCLNWLDWHDSHRQSKLDLLPVKAVIQGEQKFSELLAAIENQISDISNYANISLATLAQALKRENSAFSASSLSQMLFKFNSFTANKPRLFVKRSKHLILKILYQLNIDNVRYGLYKIDWIRENFVDQTSRNFARTEYIRQKRAQKKVNQEYVIRPYSGKVCLFRAADDMDSKLGWQELAKSGLSIDDIPGEHLEILEEPNVQVLAEKIQLKL